MKSILQTSQDDSEDNSDVMDFHKADAMRGQALGTLHELEKFYFETLELCPDDMNFDQAHNRGKIEGMLWQVRQLKSLTSLFYSQAGQDHFLDTFVFNGKRNGVFVEVGGFDGVTSSNCLFFEATRRWSGILVEPAEAPMKHAKLFRNCECIQAAVGPKKGDFDFLCITDGYTQMSGLIDEFKGTEIELLRGHQLHKEKIIKVPTLPLQDLLRDHNLKDIDYCSLDVEGAEYSILSNFPFDEFNIRAWTIENNRQTTDIAELMISKGYELLVVLGVDEIYKKVEV
ncbi:MAG: FkbM family methyltransferase [Methyloligellaceae bacterium]